MGAPSESALLAPLLAVAVFALYFVKHVMEALARRSAQAAKSKSLICALYAEIKANTEDLYGFLDAAPSIERVRQAAHDNPEFRPHITIMPHKLVYGSHLAELSCLPRAVIGKLVAFYCQLDRLSELVYGLERVSFERISAEARAQVIEELWRELQNGAAMGRDLLHALELHAPLGLLKGAIEAGKVPLGRRAAVP